MNQTLWQRVREDEDLDEVSEKILNGALACFTRFGMRRSTMDDIAAEAGIGRATVYRRFDGRDEIVRAVILRELRRFIVELDAALGGIEDPHERFVESFVVTIRHVRTHELLGRMVETEPELLLPFLTTGGTPVVAVGAAYITSELEQMKADGLVDSSIDAAVAGELLARLCHSLLLTPHGLIDADDEAGLRRLAQTYLSPALFG